MSKIATYTDIEPVYVTNYIVYVDFSVRDANNKPMEWDNMTLEAEIYLPGQTTDPVFTLQSQENEIRVEKGEMTWIKDISAMDPKPAEGEYDLRLYITLNGQKLLRGKGILIIEN